MALPPAASVVPGPSITRARGPAMSDNRRDRDAYGSASSATAPATDAGRVTRPISRPVIVLITAFESSDPPNRNASAVLLDALMQNIAKLEDDAGGAIIRTKLMPGDTHALEQALSSALDERPAPTHLLAIGQAPGRN